MLERRDVVLGQLAGELDAFGRVGRESAITHREVEHLGEQSVGPLDARGAETTLQELGHPCLHFGVRDVP
jgi:hypothetical protein